LNLISEVWLWCFGRKKSNCVCTSCKKQAKGKETH
jgi:hypothetical protein